LKFSKAHFCLSKEQIKAGKKRQNVALHRKS